MQSISKPTFQSYAVQTISTSNLGGHIQITANHCPSKNLGKKSIYMKNTVKGHPTYLRSQNAIINSHNYTVLNYIQILMSK